jgi:hypothetical protein
VPSVYKFKLTQVSYGTGRFDLFLRKFREGEVVIHSKSTHEVFSRFVAPNFYLGVGFFQIGSMKLRPMYFRTKSIKGCKLVQLVESYRNEEGQPRQRVVVSYPLGDALLEGAGLNASQFATAQLLVTSRRIEPSSDSCVPGGRRIESAAGAKPRSPRERASQWALIDWAERTALPELPGVRITKSGQDRLYHVGDALFAHRRANRGGVAPTRGRLFGPAGGVVLYDLTNTHFEGLCQKNPKVRHGKQTKTQRLPTVGMAFDSRGLARADDVFEGNIAETKTLERMLDRLALPGTEAAKPTSSSPCSLTTS